MYDLIYTENYDDYNEIKKIIQNNHFSAIIEDASDGIHTNRFSVEYKIGYDDWFSFLIKNGFALLSLNFQLELRINPDNIKKLVEKLVVT